MAETLTLKWSDKIADANKAKRLHRLCHVLDTNDLRTLVPPHCQNQNRIELEHEVCTRHSKALIECVQRLCRELGQVQ